MSALEYRNYAARRANQLRIDAVHACRVGRSDIAAMLRASARVYLDNARFAELKVTQ